MADAQGIAVFDLTAIDVAVFSLLEFEFNRNGATTMIFNTDEETYKIAANFPGRQRQGNNRRILDLEFLQRIDHRDPLPNSAAPSSPPTLPWKNTANIEGTVVTNTLTQYSEITSNRSAAICQGETNRTRYGTGHLAACSFGHRHSGRLSQAFTPAVFQTRLCQCEISSNLTIQLHRT